MTENGRDIVTGCYGVWRPTPIRAAHPACSRSPGRTPYEALSAPCTRRYRHCMTRASICAAAGPAPDATALCLSQDFEGCKQPAVSFCIIPSIRGISFPARWPRCSTRPSGWSRPASRNCCHQPGYQRLWHRHQVRNTKFHGREVRARFYDMAKELGRPRRLGADALCLSLPTCGRCHPLDGRRQILPYLDIPFQHAAPNVLKAMRRPANQEKVLDRLAAWRTICPDIAIRSTFIVGFPQARPRRTSKSSVMAARGAPGACWLLQVRARLRRQGQ